jgi:tRNA threonylcarbamoyl adenosine modification protein YeaZ
MKILAIETTGQQGSVAALLGEKLLFERMLPSELRSAASLVPAMRDLLSEVGWLAQDVGLVAVVVGPGSFTGLRIGVTTAKCFAYAVGARLLGLSTFEVLAAQADDQNRPLSIAIDAQRGDVFTARLQHCSNTLISEVIQLLPRAQWLASLQPGDHVSGPGLVGMRQSLPAFVRAVDEDRWWPTAAWAGRLASKRSLLSHPDDVMALTPLYVRPSAAEEKRALLGDPQLEIR